jgi:hypothetical protein
MKSILPTEQPKEYFGLSNDVLNDFYKKKLETWIPTRGPSLSSAMAANAC